MTTAICIPSRRRPHLLRALVENIEEATPEPHAIYFAVEDAESERVLSALGVPFLSMPDTTMVEKLNALAEVSTERYFYGGQDDSVFTEGWLSAGIAAAESVQGIASIGDGRGNIPTALFLRSYIEDPGAIVDTPGAVAFPGYWHYWSEIETMETAKYRGRYARCDEAVVRHNHWTTGHAPVDDTYQLNLEHGRADALLFRSRRHLWHPEVTQCA